jgi:hypothetical protein
VKGSKGLLFLGYRFCVPDVFVGGGREGEENHYYGVNEDGLRYAKILDEEAGEGEAERLAAEGDEAKDAVDAALKFVGNYCAAVAELDDVVDRSGNVCRRREDTQDDGVGGNDIEGHDKGKDPGSANDGLAEAETLLNRGCDEGTEDGADTADGKDDANGEGGGAHTLGEDDDDEDVT